MTDDRRRKSRTSECHGARMRATQYPPHSTCARKLVNISYWVARTVTPLRTCATGTPPRRAMTGPA